MEEALEEAKKALAAGEAKASLQHCKAALKAAKQQGASLYPAFLMIGQAATKLGEFSQAELAYRKALEDQALGVEAWQGLADLFSVTGNYAGIVEANEKLVKVVLAGDVGARARAQRALADAYAGTGQLHKAVQQLQALLQDAGLAKEARLELLCKLADIQLKLDEAHAAAEIEARAAGVSGAAGAETEAGAGEQQPERTISMMQLDVLAHQAAEDEMASEQPTSRTLLEIVALAPHAERYNVYQEEWLKRLLLRIFASAPRCVERQQARLAALRACRDLIFKGGCTPLPFEAAVWLLEEEEEIKGGLAHVGGQVVGSSCALAGGVHLGGEGHIGRGQYAVLWAFENFARRMVHQFPTNPTARVCLALMLRRRACGNGMRPIPQALRRQIQKLLAEAMADALQNDCATGWKALAELQYENRDYAAAFDTACKGLAWLRSRRERGHEALSQCALSLRLVVAKALRRMGKLDDAERHFKVLAGWVTEGEAAFAEMSGSAPVSIHQQALRGLALVDLQRGDRQSAKAQYERILGAAALGRGAAEHWAHADYGWLLYEDGDLHGARENLEEAIRVSMSAGAYATDSQLAEHYYRLGEVYWKMRGRYRSEKQFAYSHFLEAAKVEGHAQAPAFAALGRYFAEVEGKPEQAMRCYKKALALDPSVSLAGDGLCDVLAGMGRDSGALQLCQEVAARAPQALWALRRAGFLLLGSKRAEEAITAFQTALRSDVRDASVWEGLGSAYHALGRFTAALKAYTRALELDSGRLFSRIQCGYIQLALGAYAEGLRAFEAALEVDGEHPAALLGAAEVLTASASLNISLGALGMAASELAAAARHASRCASQNGTLETTWKQLGDALVRHHSVTPDASLEGLPVPAGGLQALTDASLAPWLARVRAVQGARRAYAKALHLGPARAGAWLDAASTFYHERQLRRSHAAFAAPAGVPERLGATTERLLRGGLRLAPASSDLWTALGCSAADSAVREYCLSRALQLDPKSVPSWVALARLYIDAGQRALADRCLQQARNNDPATAAIWEAMAALAALSPAGEKDVADFAEHSLGLLGVGPEGLLTFAEAAIRAGRGLEGSVYAAARRLPEMQPLNPAAHNVLGLASEARGDCATAVRSYQAALGLMGAHGMHGTDPLLRHPTATLAGAPLLVAIRLNLARALCGDGRHQEACNLYGELEFEAELDGHPHALVSYALTQLHTGNCTGARYALQSALRSAEAGSDSAAAAEATAVLMQVEWHDGKPAQAVATLQQQLGLLGRLNASAASVQALWLAAAAAALVTQDEGLLTATVLAAQQWAGDADAEEPGFLAELFGMLGMHALADQQPQRALRLHARATHLCPWSALPRVALAGVAMQVSPAYAVPAQRMLAPAVPPPAPAVAAVAGGPPAATAPFGQPLAMAALEAGVAALMARCASSVKQQAVQQLSAAAGVVHADPTNARAWYLAALCSTQRAAADGQRGSYHSARRWCGAASAVLEHRRPAGQQAMQAQLAICASECLLKAGGSPAEALAAVRQAAQLAGGNAPLAAAVYQADARCRWAAGDAAGAEASFNQVLSHCPADAAAVIDLAALLSSAGRSEEASAVLQEAALPGSPFQPLLLLHLAQMLAGRDLEGAKAAALAADRAAGVSSLGLAAATDGISKVVQGALCLQQARQAADAEAAAAALGEARRALAAAVARADGAVPRALLAEVEFLGSMRRRQEKVEVHVQQALKLAERPVAAELYRLLSSVLGGSLRLCAKAVHAQPWQRSSWTQLATCTVKSG